MSDDELGEDIAGAPAKAGGSKLVVILLGLNLAISGFVAFKVLTMATPTVIAAPAAGSASAEPGPIHQLDAFVVNLNDPKTTRFLKLTVDLEMADAKAIAAMIKVLPALRDAVMRYLSNLKFEDTMGEPNRIRIQEELLARIATELGEDKVKRLFFAEFVVQ